jgi:hypothetical protein
MKILFVPTVTGGTTVNPWFSCLHIDDLGVLCNLESQGNEVTIATFYRRPKGRLNWPRSLPFFFEKDQIHKFDAVLVHPKIVGTMKYLANPALHARPNYYKHSEIVLQALGAFEGPIFTVINDFRPGYAREWDIDWEAYTESQLLRSTHILSKEATKAFPRIISRVEKRFHSDLEDRWEAKWAMENLVDLQEVKDFDFIFDGYNKLSNYSKERRDSILAIKDLFPNSATMGRLAIKDLPNVSNGKMLDGFSEVWPQVTRAKYRQLSWEPFHKETNRLWTIRTISSLASNSLTFTSEFGTPFLQRNCEDLSPATKAEITDQHELLFNFSAKENWPVDLTRIEGQ